MKITGKLKGIRNIHLLKPHLSFYADVFDSKFYVKGRKYGFQNISHHCQ